MKEDGEKFLTKREHEVLKWVVIGLNNSEIAQELHVTVNTVKKHLKNIFMKLNIDNRIKAAVIAVKTGLF